VWCRCCPDGMSLSIRTPRYPPDMSDAECALAEPTLVQAGWPVLCPPSAEAGATVAVGAENLCHLGGCPAASGAGLAGAGLAGGGMIFGLWA